MRWVAWIKGLFGAGSAFTSPAALAQFAAETEAMLRQAGLPDAAVFLQAVRETAYATGSEWHGELGLAARQILARRDVPKAIRMRLQGILAQVRRS